MEFTPPKLNAGKRTRVTSLRRVQYICDAANQTMLNKMTRAFGCGVVSSVDVGKARVDESSYVPDEDSIPESQWRDVDDVTH